ncbi:PREDICTED: uncharacterized protein LOC109154746 [Ipomoea nil]|uniref:uncharacterized protein LOC109154746 n=1 Tax=Ipomoea nil TaxID=35883 RepID=UPI000901D6BF|nr:PREDICTED: uncharacterized protein LOC109154746 [Ipomoea nil]
MSFGGKTVVLGGDFRQILPVIPKCSRQEIVQASINSLYLWSNFEVLRLTKNLRLRGISSAEEVAKLNSFAKWIADLGDGNLGEEKNGVFNIRIPDNFVLRNEVDPIAEIVQSTFPSYGHGQFDHKFLESRAILAPTLDVVDKVNEYMNSMNEATSKTYLSCDSVCKSDTSSDMLSEVHTTEFLNSLRCSGVPNHSLTLKVGSPIMLLRNIDHSLGLCNGTRLIITQLGNHVIEAQILCGNNAGTRVLIPRLGLTPSDPRLPFKFQRKQFPIMLSYAMTINKSQGQTLSNVGLLLKKPVFNHGQLYVAASRCDGRVDDPILQWFPEELRKFPGMDRSSLATPWIAPCLAVRIWRLFLTAGTGSSILNKISSQKYDLLCFFVFVVIFMAADEQRPKSYLRLCSQV